MKTKYAIMNEKGEFFSHFTEWQGTVHANWAATKPKLINSLTLAKQRKQEIKNLCFKDAYILAVVFHKREVQHENKI